ncbi:MAG: S24 family peptidase [Microgenomates group bacterium]|nr:S24 family peptidase [Microgenomates group bacterium]
MREDLLNIVKSFFRKNKRLPSYSEMLSLFGFSSKNSVFKIVRNWIKAGFLKKENSKLAPTTKFFSLPLLGFVRAGFPILAEENKNYLSLDEYLIENPEASFLLKVNGDSLAGIGIFEGDIVIIERKTNASPGDVVLAQIDKEWTLKILRKERGFGRTFLVAANPRYPPLYPRFELQIYGVVKAVIRKFN